MNLSPKQKAVIEELAKLGGEGTAQQIADGAYLWFQRANSAGVAARMCREKGLVQSFERVKGARCMWRLTEAGWTQAPEDLRQ